MELIICKGRRRRREKGRLGKNITNCILTVHKVRRHGTDDKVGGCDPDGNKHNGENDSLGLAVFAWGEWGGGKKFLFA